MKHIKTLEYIVTNRDGTIDSVKKSYWAAYYTAKPYYYEMHGRETISYNGSFYVRDKKKRANRVVMITKRNIACSIAHHNECLCRTREQEKEYRKNQVPNVPQGPLLKFNDYSYIGTLGNKGLVDPY